MVFIHRLLATAAAWLSVWATAVGAPTAGVAVRVTATSTSPMIGATTRTLRTFILCSFRKRAGQEALFSPTRRDGQGE
jgi:hypothetical protein